MKPKKPKDEESPTKLAKEYTRNKLLLLHFIGGVTKPELRKKYLFIQRDTFATVALTQGVDLYTVSKLLGHSDIKVTQVYAKIR